LALHGQCDHSSIVRRVVKVVGLMCWNYQQGNLQPSCKPSVKPAGFTLTICIFNDTGAQYFNCSLSQTGANVFMGRNHVKYR